MNKHENLIKNLGNPQNWFYCGDNQSPEGKKYYKKKIGHTIFPSFKDTCQCGHKPIKRQYYIRNKFTNEIKIIGSECKNTFLPKQNRKKTCQKCGDPHQNRKDDLCNNCRPKKKKEKNVVLKVVQIYIIIENIMNVMTVVKQTVLNVKKMIYTKTTVMSIVVNIVKK